MKVLLSSSLLLASMLAATTIAAAKTGQNFYNVRDLGAISDGQTLNTEVIQRAIDACTEAGGGTVYLPPGIYKAGTLYLKSNVTLYLESGATLLQSRDLKDYVKAEKGSYVYWLDSQYAFLHGRNVKNASIIGKGTIDGNKGDKGRVHRGPISIIFENSENILIKDITVIDSSSCPALFFE